MQETVKFGLLTACPDLRVSQKSGSYPRSHRLQCNTKGLGRTHCLLRNAAQFRE